ncbi:MAG TPA: hypothetical protein VEZ11_18420, partial [Thermoanaerobaculia bacterium]|nr:hypothetical protein [Thermoanaerobaculia bacterium]
MKRIPALIVVLVALCALASTAVAQMSSPMDTTPRSDVLTSTDAPLGPHDVIDLKVFQDPSLNTRAAVGDDGKVY